jgi:hypothetical protein
VRPEGRDSATDSGHAGKVCRLAIHRYAALHYFFAGETYGIAAVTKVLAMNSAITTVGRINDAEAFVTGWADHFENSIQSMCRTLYRTCLNAAIY